jgi:peptidoglycan-associated lipoprotein
VTVERDGYFPKEFEFNTVGFYEERTFTSDMYLEKAPSEDTETRTVVINEPIRLNNIYYDFDDDKILLDAEKDLEAIMGLMDAYPTMVIELSSHTDAQGNDSYNERLSQRRAQSAVDWLISAGIDPDRMEAVGYGENQILNKCTNGVRCTDDEHRFNRRTEFKIIAGPTSIEIRQEVLPGDEKKKLGTSSTLNLNPAVADIAELTFDEELVDFGEVERGEKRVHTFYFENTGNVDVEIDLVSSCDCTTIDWPEGKKIRSGERDSLHATFDSTEKEESETVDIDVILVNTDKNGNPIFYTVRYKFVLIQ